MYEIPNAITSVMFMGNGIEIALDNSALSDYTAAAGSDLYIRFNGMGGELVAMDGSDLMFFESTFFYQFDSTEGDGSGGTPPEGDATGNSFSFDSAYYDVDSQILRVDLFGDIQSADEISIKGGLSVYTDSNYESVMPNAITSVMPNGNIIEISLDNDLLSSYTTAAGTDLYIKYDGEPGFLVGSVAPN